MILVAAPANDRKDASHDEKSEDLAVGMMESGTSRDCNSKTIWSVKDRLLGCGYIAARLELFVANPAVGTAPSNDPAAGWLHHCHMTPAEHISATNSLCWIFP